MATTLVTFERRTEESGDVLHAQGELDLTNAESLGEAVAGATAPTVILDLSRLTFIDSAGMRAIDRAHRRLAQEGRRLLLVAPDGCASAWTLRVAGFPDELVLESLDAVTGTDGR